MKAAFAVWNHRIAPVFDFSREILLVDVESGGGGGRGAGTPPRAPAGARGGGPGGGGGGGQGAGRVGGPSAAGPGGFCVCPRCGRKEPHERGVPCMQKQCPACGVAMTRS